VQVLSARPDETRAKTASKTEENFILTFGGRRWKSQLREDAAHFILPAKKKQFIHSSRLEKLGAHVSDGNVRFGMRLRHAAYRAYQMSAYIAVKDQGNSK